VDVPDFSVVTEHAGDLATREQLERLLDRTYVAVKASHNARVLDLACGTGAALGEVAKAGSSVLAGDITHSLLVQAKSHYADRIPLVQLDASALPFANASFDLVTMFEAIYYLPDVRVFLAEVKRVLGAKGKILISTVNREWDEAVPSALSTKYFGISELREALSQAGFVDLATVGAFSTETSSGARGVAARWLRRLGKRVNISPKTLRGREFLKRVMYGHLDPLPAEVTLGDYAPSSHVQLDEANSCTSRKILYVSAGVP
jgi:ubiquinone/menaquinone biosynthesis C-methylase UbiE